jgi:hypothetical protein
MIKQIWFDFGNIFIPIFPERTKKAFEARGVKLSDEAFSKLNVRYEVGDITPVNSCKILRLAVVIFKAPWQWSTVGMLY